MVDPVKPISVFSAEEAVNSRAIGDLNSCSNFIDFANIIKNNFDRLYVAKNKFERSLNSVETSIAKTDLNHCTLFNMQVALSKKIEKLEKTRVAENGIGGDMHQFVKNLEEAQKEISDIPVLVRTFVHNMVNKYDQKFDAIDKSLADLKGIHTDLSLKMETLEKEMTLHLHNIKDETGGDAERFKPQSLEKQNSEQRIRKKAQSDVAPKAKMDVEMKICKDEASAEIVMETLDSHPEWKVEKILDKRTLENGQVQYFLKWVDWEERFNSWVAVEKLNCPQLLEQFESELKNVTKNGDPMQVDVAEEDEEQQGQSEAMPDL